MSVRISVVIPNLNSPLIDRTLAALAVDGAPGPEVEVLVIGRDKLGLVPRNGQVQFLESETELNPAAARNRGVAAAKGERLFFTDADCRPLPGWRATLDAALDESPIAGGAVTFDLGANLWAVADNIAAFRELLTDRPTELSTQGTLGTLNLATTRAAWEQTGPFDEGLTTSEDVEWVLRARAAGLTTAFVNTAVVEHAAVRDSLQSVRDHATWYGCHLHAFRSRCPGALDGWRSRNHVARTAPFKALFGTLLIFLRHPRLLRRPTAAVGVFAFRRAWYRAVLESWPNVEQ
jgi:GT2 family glycosyltransferase